MELKTMNIKGKEYVQVNDRLKAFRSMPEFSGWSLTTEIVELKDDSCTMKAVITDDQGRTRATGYAREVIAKSPVNKFAFVENCETSAWGRALGNLGIGIDSAVCSAEELLQKLAQDIPVKTPAEKAEETREANKKAFEERFASMYAYFKGQPKWSYTLEDRFNEVMKEATSKGYEPDKCSEMLEIFDKLEKDSIPTDICEKGIKPEEYLQAG